MTGGPLTILQVTHQGGPAGSTQSIFNLSQYLNRRGHRVLLGCRGDVLLARLAREAGLPVIPLVFTPRRELTRALGAVLAREGVDVINSHATLDRRALTWLRWRGRLSQAFVVTRRTMPRTSPLELLPVGLTADRTIAVSEAVARTAAATPSRRAPPRRAERHRPRARGRAAPAGRAGRRADSARRPRRAAGGRDRLPSQGPARGAPGALSSPAGRRRGVRGDGAGRPSAGPGPGPAGPPSRRVRAVRRARPRLLSPGYARRSALPHGRSVAVAARGDGAGAAGRGVRRRRQLRSRSLGRDGAARPAARPGGVGGGARAPARGRRAGPPPGPSGPRAGARRVHAGADRRAHRSGVPRGAGASSLRAIARGGGAPLAFGT